MNDRLRQLRWGGGIGVPGTAVLLIAAFLRIFAFQDVPPGLSQDEVLNAGIVGQIRGGYHAWFFRDGFGHEPLYHYFSVPFQAALGDNVLSIRLPAVALGLILVALTMRWARREFGAGTAVVAGLGLAISWWPIIFSRVGLRPILEPVLLVLAAWFWPKRPLLSGLFLGLSLYSYTGARVVFLMPLLFAIYWYVTQKGNRKNETNLGLPAIKVLLIAVLVAAPMFLTLWADPTLQQRVDQLAGPLEALQEGDATPILESGIATLGVFNFTGDPRWTYSLPNRPLFDWGTAVLFYAGLLIVLWHWRQPRVAYVLIWLGVTLIPSAVTPQSPSTVRLVGAMPVIYLMPGLAVTAVINYLKAKDEKAASWRITGLQLAQGIFLVILLVNFSRTWVDGFIDWPQAETTRLNHYQTVLLDMARHWRENPAGSLVVAEAFFEPIDQYSLIRTLGTDPQARWIQTGSEVAGAIIIPGGGDGRLYVPEFAPPAPELLEMAGLDTIPHFRSQNQPSFAIYQIPATLPTLQNRPSVLFGNIVSLIGYEILPLTVEDHLVVFTLWRVEQQLPSDLAAFVHLVDSENQIMAQHDGLDAASTTLQPGDLVLQRHNLVLGQHLPPDHYALYVGLYQRGNDQRLLIADGLQDRFMLAPFIVDE